MKLYRSFLIRHESHIASLIAFIRSNWQSVDLVVEVREKQDKRSLEQNARLHVLLTEIADKAWVEGKQYSMETWKEFARRKWIGIDTKVLPNGEIVEHGISTTVLSVSDFSTFLMNIEAYAIQELGVILDER